MLGLVASKDFIGQITVGLLHLHVSGKGLRSHELLKKSFHMAPSDLLQGSVLRSSLLPFAVCSQIGDLKGSNSWWGSHFAPDQLLAFICFVTTFLKPKVSKAEIYCDPAVLSERCYNLQSRQPMENPCSDPNPLLTFQTIHHDPHILNASLQKRFRMIIFWFISIDDIAPPLFSGCWDAIRSPLQDFDSLGLVSEICRHAPQKACPDFWWQCQDQYASPGNYGWCVWSPGPVEELGCSQQRGSSPWTMVDLFSRLSRSAGNMMRSWMIAPLFSRRLASWTAQLKQMRFSRRLARWRLPCDWKDMDAVWIKPSQHGCIWITIRNVIWPYMIHKVHTQ